MNRTSWCIVNASWFDGQHKSVFQYYRRHLGRAYSIYCDFSVCCAEFLWTFLIIEEFLLEIKISLNILISNVFIKICEIVFQSVYDELLELLCICIANFLSSTRISLIRKSAAIIIILSNNFTIRLLNPKHGKV